MITPGIDAIVS